MENSGDGHEYIYYYLFSLESIINLHRKQSQSFVVFEVLDFEKMFCNSVFYFSYWFSCICQKPPPNAQSYTNTKHLLSCTFMAPGMKPISVRTLWDWTRVAGNSRPPPWQSSKGISDLVLNIYSICWNEFLQEFPHNLKDISMKYIYIYIYCLGRIFSSKNGEK